MIDRSRLLDAAPAIRRRILFITAVGTPVMFLRITHDPFNVPKLFLLTVGVTMALALRIIEGLQGRSWAGLRILVLPASAMAIPLVLSWALSPYKGWAVMGLEPRFEGLVPYLLVILLGVLVADAFRDRPIDIAVALSWAGAIVGGYAVIQILGLDPFQWSLFGAPTDAISTTGNPNFTGGFLGIVLPIGIAIAISQPERRRLVGRLLVLTVAGWLVARSQGGWAAGVAGSVLVAGSALRERFRPSYVLGWGVAALVVVATIGSVVVAGIRPESRFATSSASDRARWAQAALSMGASSPIFGRGPNSFTIEGVEYRTLDDALEFNFDFPDDPHSVPASMFANLGLLGLLGFLFVMGWATWFLLTTEDPSLLQIGFFAAVLAYFVQSLVSIDEMTLRVALWTAIGGLAACAFAEETATVPAFRSRSKARGKAKTSATPIKAPVAVGLVGLVALASIAWAASLVIADTLVRQGSTEFATGQIEEGRSKYRSATGIRDAADYHGLLAFQLKRAALRDGEADQELVDAADDAFSFTDDVPYLFSIVSRARLLRDADEAGASADLERALALYERAIAIDDLNPLIRAETALMMGRLGQHEDAFDLLMVQRDVVGNAYPEYWGALALEAAEVGEEEIATDAVSIALALQAAQPQATQAQELLDKGAVAP
jgi:tetratricopeptide (TPR) repeat protein